MKKLVAVLLAAAMTMSVCACGNTDVQTENEAETKETSEVADTSASEETKVSEVEEEDSLYPIVDEPITVKGLVVSPNTDVREDRLVWNKVSEITGINIEWEFIDKEALGTYLAGSDWPDFIHYHLSNSVVTDYGVVGGKFVNYLDYLEYMPNLVQMFEDYPQSKKNVTEVNGEIYSLPGWSVSATDSAARPYVRTDVLEAAGLDMPTTVDEFYDALVTLKEKNGEAGFVPLLSDDATNWGPMLFAAFGPLTSLRYEDDGTGQVIFTRNTEQMRLYLEWMNKLYEEGLIHQEYLTLDSTARLELAKSGKVAFIGGKECTSLATEDFADGEFHIDCLAPLTSEYDSTQVILGKSGYFNTGGFFMNAESEYIVEMCKMFDIMYATEEVVEGSGLHGISFMYGMEGVDWEYGPEGSGVYLLNVPEGYDGAFSTYQQTEIIWANAGRADAFAGLVTETVSNNRARQLGFVNNVIPYQAEEAFPEAALKYTEDEQYVIDNKWTDIKNYYKEMEGKFITGVADIATEWDDYCETLDKMGLAECMEVYQASYDRYNGK